MWYIEASKANVLQAIFLVGVCYKDGKGIDRNLDTAADAFLATGYEQALDDLPPNVVAAARRRFEAGEAELPWLKMDVLAAIPISTKKAKSVAALSTTPSSEAPSVVPDDVARIPWDQVQMEDQSLGKGAYGSVHVAQWRGETLAIKMMKGVSEEAVKREAEMLWRFQGKPGIIGVHGVLVSEDGTRLVGIVMEKAQSLRERIRGEGVSGTEARRLLHDVASALEVLHHAAKIHMDIKAANILVRDDGSAVLCDFGFVGPAAVMFRRPMSMHIGGTLAWMAPEVIVGDKERIGRESDMFSFGVLAYELATGATPWAARVWVQREAARLPRLKT